MTLMTYIRVTHASLFIIYICLLVMIYVDAKASHTDQSKFVQQQEVKPITKQNLLSSLKLGKEQKKSASMYIDLIKQYGVDFQVVASVEMELRQVGSYLGRDGLDSLIAAVKENFRPETNDLISINYMRLFGAFQAPFILDNLYLGNSASDRPIDIESNYTIAQIWPKSKLVDFWKKWEYRGSKPLKTRVWDEIFNSSASTFMPDTLLEIACEGDAVTAQYYGFKSEREKTNIYSIAKAEFNYEGLSKEEIEQFGALAFPGQYSTKEVLNALKEKSKRIGFLILILENTSSNTLMDGKLVYKEFVNGNLSGPYPDEQTVEVKIQQVGEQTKEIPPLRSNESFLMLLAVYKKDDRGYPQNYITSVTRPLKISYRLAGRAQYFTQDIRLPKLDSAIKVEIPFGWYYQ